MDPELHALATRYPRVAWRRAGVDTCTGRSGRATLAVFRSRGVWLASCQLDVGAPVDSARGHDSPVAALDALAAQSEALGEVLSPAPAHHDHPAPAIALGLVGLGCLAAPVGVALEAARRGWVLLVLVAAVWLLLCAVAA